MSGLNFWSDIIEIARGVDHNDKKPNKLKFIISKLKLINKFLPSFVFVPSNSKINYKIFNIFLTFFFRICQKKQYDHEY